MNDKKYILHYPSRFGMGSNTDIMLISDEDVRYIIRTEVERKLNGKSRFCERFTGTWNGEKFCDSNDMSEVEEDVIRKRLSTCSTYAGVNDLIELPADIPLTITEQKEENCIFHVWNQYMTCFNDIIAGETVFTQYFLDLTNYEDFAGLHKGKICEFVSYDMKHVLRNPYFLNHIDTVLDIEKRRYLRFESKINGTYKVDEGKYLDDLIDMDGEELYKQYKKEYEDVAAKFAESIICPDIYLERMYMDSPASWYYDDLRSDIKELMSKCNFRELAYKYPQYIHSLGAVFSEKKDDNVYFRYDELFKTGCDIRYLPAIETGTYESRNEITLVKAFYALRNVFGDL